MKYKVGDVIKGGYYTYIILYIGQDEFIKFRLHDGEVFTHFLSYLKEHKVIK